MLCSLIRGLSHDKMKKTRKNESFFISSGFTLVEILVTLGLVGIVSAAMYKTFQIQQHSYMIQEQVVEMQQNVRAAMDIMVQDIRMAGYDPKATGTFGFVCLPGTGSPDYGRYTASDGIAFYTDNGSTTTPSPPQNGNGILDNSDSEQVAFRVNTQQTGAALTGSARDYVLRKYSIGGVHWQPLAENIEAIGFAYAFDSDGDGQLDKTSNGNIIWAIDLDKNGTLDANLDTNDDGNINLLDLDYDTNDDGVVDSNDDTNGDGDVNLADISGSNPAPLPVNISAIRAVKIWVLARTSREDRSFNNNSTYVVSDQVLTANDGYRRRLLTTVVKCRNMGLQ